MKRALKDLNEQVFQFLLEWHFREKAEGRESYFYMEPFPEAIFRTQDDSITTTFWRNDFPGEQYFLNLSISLDDSVVFWIPFGFERRFRKIENLPSLFSMVKNEEKQCWELTYTSGITWSDRLDEFFSKDFHQIKKEVDARYQLNVSSSHQKLKGGEIRAISPFIFEEMLNNVIQNRNLTAPERTDWPLLPGGSLGILSFEFWNFRGIQHTRIEGIRTNTRWIFLTGENGFGKSSILQAITITLVGTKDLTQNELGENWLLATEWHDHDEAGVNCLYWTQTTSAYEPKKKVAAYGSSRLQLSNGTDPGRALDQSALHIFSPFQHLLNIENELIRSNSYRKEQFNYIKELILAAIPDLADIEIVSRNTREEVIYYEQNREGDNYSPVSFYQLASGFRSLVGLLGDIYLRLSAGSESPVPPQELEGIIIIDEIELHLHPNYQRALPKKLSELFPKVQFIVSTHSPIPLLGAPKETVIIHVNRSEETGIIAEMLNIDIGVLQPNAILTSPIFGFRGITAESHESGKVVHSETEYEAIGQTQKIIEEVNDFLSDEKQQELKKLFKK